MPKRARCFKLKNQILISSASPPRSSRYKSKLFLFSRIVGYYSRRKRFQTISNISAFDVSIANSIVIPIQRIYSCDALTIFRVGSREIKS